MLARIYSYRSITSGLANRRLSTFDLAAKLSDSSSPSTPPCNQKKRKPSDRVLRLTEEILNLSLIEAADLCDLCTERLGGPRGVPAFFPMMAAPSTAPIQSTLPVEPPTVSSTVDASAASSQPAATPSAATVKSTVTIKLMSFEATKKVQTVKEVRTLTALGLKEAKEAVEAAPKVLKKGVPIEEANAWKKKLMEECGAVVELE